VEAGERGWESIEYKEIYQSAQEFIGKDAVHKTVVDKSQSYVSQVHEVLKINPVTHFLYDPRSGSQEYLKGFYEAVMIALLFARYRVVPIVYLTDLSFRLWRCQAAAVSAANGVVVTFMMPKRVQPIFPHRRLVGPSLMPFSRQLLDSLETARTDLHKTKKIEPIVRFTGSLYEPRTTFLSSLTDKLQKKGKQLEVLGRELGSKRVSDEEYWRRISSAQIVITTAVQASQPGIDWEWVPHLVYRYLEVMAAGSVLLAPAVPGVEKYFKPGEHFIAFDTLDSASEQASYFLDNPKKLEVIRKAGHERARELVRSHSFWIQVDTALGFEALVRS